MSAVLKSPPWFESMDDADVDAVADIERRIYEFPWTPGNFRDSIGAGYSCWVFRDQERMLGYAVLMLAAGEAHLLNLSVDAPDQGLGHGSRMLGHLMQVARDYGARYFFLEVRQSNESGRRLYERHGFRQIAVRRGYYPAKGGREDALLLVLNL